MPRQRNSFATSALALLLLQGCISVSDTMGPPDMDPLDTLCDGSAQSAAFLQLEFPGGTSYVQVGDSLIVRAKAFDERCDPMVADLMTSWSSSSAAKATIEALPPLGESAVVRTHAVGSVQASVTWSRSSTYVLYGWVDVVIIPRISTFTFTPSSATIRVGDSLYVAAAAKTASGQGIPDIPVQLSAASSSVAVLTYLPNGAWVRGAQPGSITVTARAFEFEAASVITVIAR